MRVLSNSPRLSTSVIVQASKSAPKIATMAVAILVRLAGGRGCSALKA